MCGTNLHSVPSCQGTWRAGGSAVMLKRRETSNHVEGKGISHAADFQISISLECKSHSLPSLSVTTYTGLFIIDTPSPECSKPNAVFLLLYSTESVFPLVKHFLPLKIKTVLSVGCIRISSLATTNMYSAILITFVIISGSRTNGS